MLFRSKTAGSGCGGNNADGEPRNEEGKEIEGFTSSFSPLGKEAKAKQDRPSSTSSIGSSFSSNGETKRLPPSYPRVHVPNQKPDFLTIEPPFLTQAATETSSTATSNVLNHAHRVADHCKEKKDPAVAAAKATENKIKIKEEEEDSAKEQDVDFLKIGRAHV